MYSNMSGDICFFKNKRHFLERPGYIHVQYTYIHLHRVEDRQMQKCETRQDIKYKSQE